MRWKKWQRGCPDQVLLGLAELSAEFPDQTATISDMKLYAAIGKDRASLTMDWVDKTRESCERNRDFAASLGIDQSLCSN